jgi:hypothetical protein
MNKHTIRIRNWTHFFHGLLASAGLAMALSPLTRLVAAEPTAQPNPYHGGPNAGLSVVGKQSSGTLEEDFANPPVQARPMVWWHWMGKNISTEGITKDLEAMKSAGIGGATIFNITSGRPPITNTPWPENEYYSAAWWALVEHAAREADRLGLKIGLHNCPGYEASGGPWITPERSMKMVVWTKTSIPGGKAVEAKLPQPTAKLNFYRDIGVVAVPDGAEAPSTALLDLSTCMSAGGALKWNAPNGNWLVYRFGYTSTGTTCRPVPEGMTALECDKLSAADSKFHFEQAFNPIREHIGPLVGKSFNHICFDSYEAGRNTNWTEGFRDAFKKRNGYDPLVWLPILDKFVIDSAELTKRFQNHFRDTISDLFIENSFRQAKTMINAMGLQMYLEPYDGPFEMLQAAKVADLPMYECFTDDEQGYQARLYNSQALAKAGKKIIGSEAFSARPWICKWSETPATLKKYGDRNWLNGVNLFFLHTWVHQPFGDEVKPGLTMGWWGTHFGRNQTWFEPGKAWIAYLSRSQALLQRGEMVTESGDCITKPKQSFIHRRDGGSDIYFFANLENSPVLTAVSLKGTGRLPELWNPENGTRRTAPVWSINNGRTELALYLEANTSVFIVLCQPTTETASRPLPQAKTAPAPLAVEGPWEVDFGRVGKISMPALVSWTQSDQPAVKYFSGTAIYRQTIDVPADWLSAGGGGVLLDLGSVRELARVRINGVDCGVSWHAPFRVEVGSALKPGRNILEIEITNTWANRLIGDEYEAEDYEQTKPQGWYVKSQYDPIGRSLVAFPEWILKNQPRPTKRQTFCTWNYFTKNSPLLESGLLGPVQLRVADAP